MWRVTVRPPSIYFYPRSPRGERLDPETDIPIHKLISIHAPREGSDDEQLRALTIV